MTNQNSIRPMGILSTIIYWAIPAAILYVSHYILVPMYVQRTGQPYLLGYLVAWISTMAFCFIAVLAGYRLEGNPFRLATFSDRYRLRRMSWQDWLWTLGGLASLSSATSAWHSPRGGLLNGRFFRPTQSSRQNSALMVQLAAHPARSWACRSRI